MLMGSEERSCGRAEALVTYVYGELPEPEAVAFRTHAVNCAQCSAELVEFGGIHRSMVDWRDATLGRLAMPAIAPEVWMPAPVVESIEPARPTFLESIFGRFAGSPLWAQAGLVTAALAVAVLGIAYWTSNSSPAGFTVAQTFASSSNSIASERVAKLDRTPIPVKEEVVVARQDQPVVSQPSTGQRRNVEQQARNRHQRPVIVESVRNQELASLLLEASDRDASVPGLSDLLTDADQPSINPNH
ncbi:MAG: hypothetical protein ABIP75_03990 [Pyrinomonadaceae bacterium]